MLTFPTARSLIGAGSIARGMIACAVMALPLVAPPASAQTNAQSRLSPIQPNTLDPAVINRGRVGILVGGDGGPDLALARDLARVLDDLPRLRIVPMVGRDPVQSLTDILFLSGVDIAVVPSDAVTHLDRERVIPGIANSIHYIAPLYERKVGILAADGIADITDLNGRTVDIGPPDSARRITAELVLGTLGIDMVSAGLPDDAAIAGLAEGSIAASVMMVGGAGPAFPAEAVPDGARWLALPEDDALGRIYRPARLETDDAPGVPAEGVATVAVPTILAVFNWPAEHERHARVGRFVEAFFANIDQLRAQGDQGNWDGAAPDGDVPGLTRFAPAAAWLARNRGGTGDGDLDRAAFEAFLEAQGLTGLTETQREALFEQFRATRR